MNRRTMLALATASVLTVSLALPAGAQTAASAEASAFGVRVLGVVPPTPEVSAAIPPGDFAEEAEALIEIPADPALISATASTAARASEAIDLEMVLQDTAETVNAGLPDAWNATGFAVTEDLEALDGNLTADVIAAEAAVSCEGGTATFATASRVQNVTLGGEVLPLEELDAVFEGLEPLLEQLEPLLGETRLRILADRPNDVILEVPELGLRIIAWETNWDGADGTTDGSDTVWVNALRVSVGEPLSQVLEPVGGEPTDIVISRAEATADCEDVAPAPPAPAPEPPAPVAPAAPLPVTGGGLALLGLGSLAAGGFLFAGRR